MVKSMVVIVNAENRRLFAADIIEMHANARLYSWAVPAGKSQW
jgi:hypothetical protein